MINRSAVREFAAIVGEKYCIRRPEDLLVYSMDCFSGNLPDVVVVPKETSEVAAILRAASQRGIPVTPRGAGTGLSGGCVPVEGGVLLSLARMNRVVEIDPRDRLAVVEPGVVCYRFQQEVEKRGLLYPPDPGSQMSCTLGGMVSTNAGGPRAVKYGVTRDYLMGLEVVLASGEILHTGGRQLKNVTGYDLTRLFCGSEGTLGIITRIIFRLLPRPETRRTILVGFHKLEDAGELVAQMLGAGIIPACLELMDSQFIRIAEERFGVGLPLEGEGFLLIDVDGLNASVLDEAVRVEEFCRAQDPLYLRAASSTSESDQLWMARRLGVMGVMRKYKAWMSEDATVPISRVPAMIRRIQRISRAQDIPIILFGHAGDGNLHPIYCFDPSNQKEMKALKAAVDETLRAAIELGGTLSGEHGIGLGKKDYMNMELTPATMGVMRTIKNGFDPKGLLNPGKFV